VAAPKILPRDFLWSLFLLAGYGRLKLFRTLFRMFRTYCASDASFGRLWYGIFFKKKPKTQSPKLYLARDIATRPQPPLFFNFASRSTNPPRGWPISSVAGLLLHPNDRRLLLRRLPRLPTCARPGGVCPAPTCLAKARILMNLGFTATPSGRLRCG
jgi:hypothetical protein